MSESHRWIQSGALVIVAAAAVPLLANGAAEWSARREATARAARSAAIGDAALAAGDPALAGQALADAVDAEPGNAGYRRRMIESHVEQILRDPTSVTAANGLRLQAELQAALADAPAAPARVRVALGKVLQLRGLDDDAKKSFEQAVEADPKLGLAHMHLGDHLLKQKQYDAAAAELDKALALDASLIEAKFALGQVRLGQEKWAEAEALLADAVQKLDRAPVHLALGRALARQDKWKDALPHLERARALAPDQGVTYGLLGDAYARLGQPEAALGAFESAYRLTGDPDALQRRAEVLEALGRHQEAAAAFGDLRQLRPTDPRPYLGLARSAQGLQQPDAARRALETAIRLAGDDPKAEPLVQDAKRQLAALAAPAPAPAPAGRLRH
jgi:tetratricopeptide (TPR) repeat protein